MKNYSFLKTAIVRTPIGEKQIDLSWNKIQDLFSREENREALYLGSPTIHAALVSWEKGASFQTEEELKSLKGSLYKYASRLSNRCTPFGMFATVAAVDLKRETQLNIAHSTFEKHTKFDMYFLGQLLPILTKEIAIRSALHYYPNNTIYTVFDTYRYVEYYFKDSVRFHKIAEVEITAYLAVLVDKSKNGICFKDLIRLLVSEEVSEDEAEEFINTLVDSQFIVSELEFTITGEDYFETLVKTFSETRFDFYEGHVVQKLLINLKSKIKDLDQNSTNPIALYEEIHQFLDNEINNVDNTKLFQVDSFRKINNGSLGFKTLKTLRPAITVLNKLQSSYENETLKEFKKQFLERYEEYEQPLVKVLDPDIGIGYGKQSGVKAPLVDDLGINLNYSSDKKIILDPQRTVLLKKLIQATKNNDFSIELTDDEINKFEENDNLYPDTFSIFLSTFTEDGKEKIHLKAVSGPSANGLIGRFSHLDKKILDLCNEVTTIENQLHPDKIIAEIVHLPQARTANILYRNFQREYEIPYLGKASVDQEHQITIDDLYVSIIAGKVVLRSKRLNKEIIPRLSNAHNYSANALPMYHFLCDIQNQEATGFGFSWGNFQNEFDFLPRLSYKDVVVSKATWNIDKIAIESLVSIEESEVIEGVRKFRKERGISDIVCLTQGDNDVLFNFNNDLSCLVFFSMIKKEKFVQLTEFLFTENSVTQNYCNEIIVSAHRNIETKEAENNTAVYVANESKDAIIPSFSIGEKWLYYKFYCGERAGEVLLNKAINPIVSQLKEKGLLEKWFFIRYHDANGSHLRFRVLLKDTLFLTECIQIVKTHIKPYEDDQIVWKTQTDNYLRELQRYGYETIEDTETIFYNDSECTLQFVDMIEGDSGEKVRWLFSLLSIDHLLEDFQFSLEEKVEIMKVAKISFGKEFNRNGNLNKQINEMFAKRESTVENFLNKEKCNAMYEPLWDIVRERSKKNTAAIQNSKVAASENRLPATLHTIVLSYIHMVCNRIFLTRHRAHEMVVYDYLFKHYNKQLFTGKSTNKEA
jgi:lantibiotic biosynthesis protein